MPNPELRICFDLASHVKGPIRHAWEEFAFRFKLPFRVVSADADITISKENGHPLAISSAFCQAVEKTGTKHPHPFTNQPLFLCKNGSPDYLGTAFYMMQGLQEYPPARLDELGRYDHSESYQAQFDCFEKNLVEKYFRAIVKTTPLLNHLGNKDFHSRVFLSQDVDMINAGLRQETFTSLKQGKVAQAVKIIGAHFRGQPTYLNMQDIIDLQTQYGYSSTFFWLPSHRTSIINTQIAVENADYDFQAANIQQSIQYTIDHNFTIGLHKSLGQTSFDDECALFKQSVLANRNHYLLFKLPDHYQALDEAKIQLDFSLGYSQKIGFRNSYGSPFVPYNLVTDRACDVLEIPLHIMDASFMYEKNIEPDQIEKSIMHFITEHRQNCVISILWHNNTFSKIKYPEWRALYERLLVHLSQEGIANISLPELLQWKEERMAIQKTSLED